jgi:hypothetical protein
MNKTLLGAAILATCGIIGVGSTIVQTKAAAAAAVQYKVVSISASGPADASRLEAQLNQIGAQGWELVAQDGSLYIFQK